ncbi:MAG: hypothetical protein HYT99_08925 [Candidatus Tectomicrobia bacterium]|nr:hypothetical protein [Candidatus Tectomicrobia bacterium]
MPEAQAITIIWSNVPKEHEEEVRKWHNLEHTTERLEGPGYLCCRRYNRESGEGRHGRLNFFEAESLAAFDSPYYLRSRNNPTPWTRKSMSLSRDGERSIARLVASHGPRPRIEPPYLYTVRFGPAEGAEEEIVAWYREEHLPRMCAVEGVLRGRLFRRVEELSDVKTEESKIHGTRGMQGSPRAFAALYDMTTLAPAGGDAWREAAGGTPRSTAALKKLLNPIREGWWLDFVKYAPAVIQRLAES